jgi:hypothetical protein
MLSCTFGASNVHTCLNRSTQRQTHVRGSSTIRHCHGQAEKFVSISDALEEVGKASISPWLA